MWIHIGEWFLSNYIIGVGSKKTLGGPKRCRAVGADLKYACRRHALACRRHAHPRGVRGHAPPENFEILCAHICILSHLSTNFSYITAWNFKPTLTFQLWEQKKDVLMKLICYCLVWVQFHAPNPQSLRKSAFITLVFIWLYIMLTDHKMNLALKSLLSIQPVPISP